MTARIRNQKPPGQSDKTDQPWRIFFTHVAYIFLRDNLYFLNVSNHLWVHSIFLLALNPSLLLSQSPLQNTSAKMDNSTESVPLQQMQ